MVIVHCARCDARAKKSKYIGYSMHMRNREKGVHSECHCVVTADHRQHVCTYRQGCGGEMDELTRGFGLGKLVLLVLFLFQMRVRC